MNNFRASHDELKAFLAAHPRVEYFEAYFTALSGVPRGKRLRRSEMDKLFSGTALLPGSIASLDILGADCEAGGLVWELGDPDCLLIPAPGTLAPAPWLGEDVAQVACSLHTLDGTPYPFDPRAVLDGVLKRLEADGFVPTVACELEMYLLEPQRTRAGIARPRRSPASGREPFGCEVVSLDAIEDASDFLRGVWKAADIQGLPVEGASAEAAPSQFELTLHHRPDALRAADEAVAFKRLCKGVARSVKCEATFMAKPWAELSGSGFHIHMSMLDREGRNVFASDDAEGTSLLRDAIGGMAATMGDAMAIFAPNANSYRRYGAHSYAPMMPNWGVNNRTVALRIPAGAASARRVEHRVAGADANPYLTLAAVLAGAHHGLTHGIDPGNPVLGDGYVLPSGGRGELPLDWMAAIERLDASQVMRSYLGNAFVDLFVAVKRTEYERFTAVVGALDYDWYLQNA